MALSAAITDAYATWLKAQRPGGKPTGTVYDCLVSDLAVGDYLVGPRATVLTIAAVSGSTRSMTLTRLGYTWTQVYVAASALRIIR
jgi:hypothetical protein